MLPPVTVLNGFAWLKPYHVPKIREKLFKLGKKIGSASYVASHGVYFFYNVVR